jgi:integrase
MHISIVRPTYLKSSVTLDKLDRNLDDVLTILNANGENPKVIQELMRHANLKVTMDTYVQAVTDEKREAQNKVVKMLLPGIRRAVI